MIKKFDFGIPQAQGDEPATDLAMDAVLGGSNQRELVGGYDAFVAAYIQREDTLILVNQLNQLTKCVQRHRGVSMGILGGINQFGAAFAHLQSELENRLATLEAFARRAGGLFEAKDKENLHLAWVTIRQDWLDDNLNDNFELHSHFVQQLLVMIAALAKRLESPLTPELAEVVSKTQGDSAFSQPRMFKQIEILDYVGKQLPNMIENLAKVRGLSSYAAAVGVESELDGRKLRFLVNSARQGQLRIMDQSDRLKSILGGEMPSLVNIKHIELKLIFLLNVIENDVLSGTTVTADPHQLFQLATEIVEVYWAVIDEGLQVVRGWHTEDLDAWCRLV